MPQRSKDFGRVVPIRIYQTETAAGDEAEGPIDVPAAETNVLEILAQNWRQVFIEGRNEDAVATSTWKFYGTRKYMEAVPPSGNAFWAVTGDHWETASADQAAVAVSTNITPVELLDKGYTYLVVTVEGSVADTSTIARAILTA
jgi:hypothetical protein